jgi:hypothetical protein
MTGKIRYLPKGEAKNSGFLLDRGLPLSESKEFHLGILFYLFTWSVPTHLAEIRTIRVMAIPCAVHTPIARLDTA